MPGDDHWVDDNAHKRSTPFSRKMGDVRSTMHRMMAPQVPGQAQRLSDTQLRLAALPPEYQAGPAVTAEQYQQPFPTGQFVQGQGAAPPPFPPPDYAQQQHQMGQGYPQGQMPPGQFPPQQPNGYPPQFQQGAANPNQYPPHPGQMHPGQMPQGQMPQGQFPPQQYPAQMYQPGYAQQGAPQNYPPQLGQPGYPQGTPPNFPQQGAPQSYSQQMSEPNYAQHSGPEFSQPAPVRPPRELTDEEIDERALRDSQTLAYNLRHTIRLARQELIRAKFFGRSLSVMVVALDNYQKILMDHSATAVEKALDALSRSLLNVCRPVDFVGRYTEGRFIIVIPEMNEQEAAVMAESVRQMTEAIVIAHQWQNLKLTASIGISSVSEDLDDLESLIALADLGSDMVSENGGNGVFLASAAMAMADET